MYSFTQITLQLSLPPRTVSLLSTIDPRWKLAALLIAIVATSLVNSLGAALFAFLGAIAFAMLARLPSRWFRTRLIGTITFLGVFAAPLPWILWDDGPTWTYGPLFLSPHGTFVAALLILKGVAIVVFSLVVLATSPLDANLKAAHALYVPKRIVQLTLMTYRYVFLLASEFARVRIALRVRGFRNRATTHCYQTIGQVSGMILVRGYERADRVSQAMRCRGFDGQFRCLESFRTTSADVLFFLLTALFSFGVWLLDRSWA